MKYCYSCYNSPATLGGICFWLWSLPLLFFPIDNVDMVPFKMLFGLLTSFRRATELDTYNELLYF